MNLKTLVNNLYRSVEKAASRLIPSTPRRNITTPPIPPPQMGREELSSLHDQPVIHAPFSLAKEVDDMIYKLDDYEPSPQAKRAFQTLIKNIETKLREKVSPFILLGAFIGGGIGGFIKDADLDQQLLKTVPHEMLDELKDYVAENQADIKESIQNGENVFEISKKLISGIPNKILVTIADDEAEIKGMLIGTVASLFLFQHLSQSGIDDDYALGLFSDKFNLFNFRASSELYAMEDGDYATLKQKQKAFETVLSLRGSSSISQFAKVAFVEMLEHFDRFFRLEKADTQEARARINLYQGLRTLNADFIKWGFTFSPSQGVSAHEQNQGFNPEEDSVLFNKAFSGVVDPHRDQVEKFTANLEALGLNYGNYKKQLDRIDVTGKEDLFYVLNQGIEAHHFSREDLRSVLRTVTGVIGQILFSNEHDREYINPVFTALLVRCPKDQLPTMLEAFDDQSFALNLVRGPYETYKIEENLRLIAEVSDENFPDLLNYLKDPENQQPPVTTVDSLKITC